MHITKENVQELKLENGNFQAYAFPGGYPLYYIMRDGGIVCPGCMNDSTNPIHVGEQHNHQWQVIGAEINYEDAFLFCEHCSNRIESAYAEDEYTKGE